jgi:Na+/proline symporter
MPRLTGAERERIDGLAVFAAVAFLGGVGVIAALERVGAPDGLVEALGPLIALAGLAVIGFSQRAASLVDFLTARRSVPAFYLGLGFAAIVGGIVLTLASGAQAARELPWLPIAAGTGLVGLVVGPALRGRNVSSPVDVLATRFPPFPVRVVFGLTLFALALLSASAGFHLTAQSFAAALGDDPRAGVAVTVVALGLTLLPGGLKSAAWTDAASGGGALLIAFGGALLADGLLPAATAPLSSGLGGLATQASALRADPLLAVAVVVGLAFYFPLLAPAMAASSATEARRTGLNGLVFAILGIAAAAVALPLFAQSPASASHAAKTLLATATALPSLALTRAGVLAASRAGGFDLARAYSRLAVLSSRRIAVQRLAMLAAIALSPFALRPLGLGPDRALVVSISGSLAFLAPPLTIALVLGARASSASALVALVGAVVVLTVEARFDPAGFAGFGLVEEAFIAAGGALALGALATLLVPARGAPRGQPAADPFVDMPFDPTDAGRASLIR